MTDQNVAWQSDSPAEPGRPNRAMMVLAAAVGVVLLATIGAVGGWVLAGGGDDPDRRAGGTPTTAAATSEAAPPSPRESARTPTVRPTRVPTTGPPRIGQIVLPQLVGTDFEEARAELRRRGLGWTLVFGAAGSDRTVASTDPRGGTTVRKGTSVRLSVLGAAPSVTVPDLVGQSCRAAANRLVDDGLYPRYPTGQAGEVQKQNPQPGTGLHWNDRVGLYCGKPVAPTVAPTL